MIKLKAMRWSITFDTEGAILFVRTSGEVPAEVKKTAESLVRAPISEKVAAKIFKTQYAGAIVAVEGNL